MTKSIFDWLNGKRDYDEGVRLFEKHGGSKVLLPLLQQGPNSFTIPKLAEALEDLRTAEAELEISKHPHDQATSPLPQSSNSRPVSRSTLTLSEEETPAEVVALIDERKKLYALNDAQWIEINPKGDRDLNGMICLNILDRRQRIKEISKQIDYFKKFGEVYKIESPKEKAADVHKALANARSNLSKHRKKGNEEKIAHYSAIVSDLEKRYKKVEDAV